MSATDPNNLRRAALALHALPQADMPKVWARLDEAQRQTLTPLLDELVSLGVPKGRVWLEPDPAGAAMQADVNGPADAVDASRRCHAVVWGVRAEQMLLVLAPQSIDTAAMLMSVAQWPWLDEAVNGWPAGQRHALRRKLEQGVVVPPSLADHLVQATAASLLARHGAAGSASQPKPAGRSWYHGLKSLFA